MITTCILLFISCVCYTSLSKNKEIEDRVLSGIFLFSTITHAMIIMDYLMKRPL